MSAYSLLQVFNNVYDAVNHRLSVTATLNGEGSLSWPTPSTPQAYGYAAAGQDAYATVLTATEEHHHLKISNLGPYPVIISVDSGTTDHFYVTGGEVNMIDDVLIAANATIKAKNGSAGNNYTELYLTIW